METMGYGGHSITQMIKWHFLSVKKIRKRVLVSQVCLTWFILLYLPPTCHSFVIAPPWANPVVNKCSRTSWQLILWPPDGKCYQIFEQGPCSRTQELGFNPITKEAECRCPKNLLYWPATDRCYKPFSRGPCEINQYLLEKRQPFSPSETSAHCQNTKICANGWIFWPPTQKCFRLYTQGPCHKVGFLTEVYSSLLCYFILIAWEYSSEQVPRVLMALKLLHLFFLNKNNLMV